MGWNSFDAYDCAINKQQFRTVVDFMAKGTPSVRLSLQPSHAPSLRQREWPDRFLLRESASFSRSR